MASSDVKTTRHLSDVKVWQVPKRDQMPSEEFIEWLNLHDDWEGDEGGISTVVFDTEDWELAEPGDFITNMPDSTGALRIVRLDHNRRDTLRRGLNSCVLFNGKRMKLYGWALSDGFVIYQPEGGKHQVVLLDKEN